MDIKIKEVTTTKKFDYSDGNVKLSGNYVLGMDGAMRSLSANAVIDDKTAGYVNGNIIDGVMKYSYQEMINENLDAVKSAVIAVEASETASSSSEEGGEA